MMNLLLIISLIDKNFPVYVQSNEPVIDNACFQAYDQKEFELASLKADKNVRNYEKINEQIEQPTPYC
jgi:hypothetical protein